MRTLRQKTTVEHVADRYVSACRFTCWKRIAAPDLRSCFHLIVVIAGAAQHESLEIGGGICPPARSARERAGPIQHA